MIVNRDRWPGPGRFRLVFDDIIRGMRTPRTPSAGPASPAATSRPGGRGSHRGLMRSCRPHRARQRLSRTGFCPVTGPVFGAGDVIGATARLHHGSRRGRHHRRRPRADHTDQRARSHHRHRDRQHRPDGALGTLRHVPGSPEHDAPAGRVRRRRGSGRPQDRSRDPDPWREHGHRHGRVPQSAQHLPSPFNANGSITVDNQGGTDGVDTLWNIEQLQFSDTTIPAVNNR